MSRKLTRVAIAYDFDGTLAPGNMQQHSFIPHLGIDSNTFWGEVKTMAKENDMNEILAYMQHMLIRAREKGVPVTKKAVVEWPALAIDYTNKTQFLFRINKGIINSWDNESINKYMPDNERHMPFNRMIYIGDGETDIPAMKML